MIELIVANLLQRPTRAIASILGIALGVGLVLVTLGLAHGMVKSSAKRETQVGAELLFQPRGSFAIGLSAAPLALPVAYSQAVARVDGVRATTPVGRHVRAGAGGLGFELIEGVAIEAATGYSSYSEVTGMRIAAGRLPRADDEVIVDRIRAADRGSLGSTVELFGRPFTVVGVFEPEVGARIKMPLASLQNLLGTPGRCSWLLVATDEPSRQSEVAQRIDRALPGNQLIFTRDIPALFARGLPSLDVFLNVVIGLAIVVSALIVFLAMYTAVTERTREIGILKSLGLSRGRVVSLILCEALWLGLVGIVVGLGLAQATRLGIVHLTSLLVEIERDGVLLAGTIALASALTGSLYPAITAAQRDPVESLAYE